MTVDAPEELIDNYNEAGWLKKAPDYEQARAEATPAESPAVVGDSSDEKPAQTEEKKSARKSTAKKSTAKKSAKK